MSYPLLIKHFQNKLDLNDEADLMIALMAVYSWMPKILTAADPIQLGHLSNQLEKLKLAETGLKLDDGFLVNVVAELSRHTNNSCVGASKFLHFLNPDIFPIWDSRVAKAIAGGAVPWQRHRTPESYLEYFRLCHRLIQDPSTVKAARDFYENVVGRDYPGTDIRGLETVFFEAGWVPAKSKS